MPPDPERDVVSNCRFRAKLERLESVCALLPEHHGHTLSLTVIDVCITQL